MRDSLPVVDLSAPSCAQEIRRACVESGFFYLAGHGISAELQQRLREVMARFFALPLEEKMKIRMALGGRAWRGFFPVGGELTSGLPDWKEGVYFGSELPPDRRPLHGPNLFADALMRDAVLPYMAAVEGLAHRVMEAIAESLGIERTFFRRQWMRRPTVLFRAFHYPPPPANATGWGVGEHTDYGVLTILLQDDVGGLQVKSRGEWIDAPPIPGTFVCNIGDMLDRMTGGLYLSTPHRVRNVAGRDRYSFPLFFDPDFDADIRRLPIAKSVFDNAADRWDGASVHAFEGTYGDYLIGKVSKVFPELGRDVL